MAPINIPGYAIFTGDYIDYLGIPLIIVSYRPEPPFPLIIEQFFFFRMQPELGLPNIQRPTMCTHCLDVRTLHGLSSEKFIEQTIEAKRLEQYLRHKIVWPVWRQIDEKHTGSVQLNKADLFELYSLDYNEHSFVHYVGKKTKNIILKRELDNIPEPNREQIWYDY